MTCRRKGTEGGRNWLDAGGPEDESESWDFDVSGSSIETRKEYMRGADTADEANDAFIIREETIGLDIRSTICI